MWRNRWECKIAQMLWKTMMVPKKTNDKLPYDAAIFLLGVHSELKAGSEQISKMQCIHTWNIIQN